MTTTSRGPLTRAELNALPDDGRRHELIDGVLVVTPAPSSRHQRAVVNLIVALHASLPDGLELMTAPFDVVVADDTVVQPDVLVARAEDIGDLDLRGAPLLVVEVLSPSTMRVDLTLKRARYEAAGCPSYWVFDPDQVELTIWELGEAGYGPPTVVRDDEIYRAEVPFPVAITPARLVVRRT